MRCFEAQCKCRVSDQRYARGSTTLAVMVLPCVNTVKKHISCWRHTSSHTHTLCSKYTHTFNQGHTGKARGAFHSSLISVGEPGCKTPPAVRVMRQMNTNHAHAHSYTHASQNTYTHQGVWVRWGSSVRVTHGHSAWGR